MGKADCGDGMENKFQKNKKTRKSLGSTKYLGGNQACLTQENRAIGGNGDRLEFSELRTPKQTGIETGKWSSSCAHKTQLRQEESSGEKQLGKQSGTRQAPGQGMKSR